MDKEGFGNCSNQSRSEEHTSELQSLTNLVCLLLLEKKTDFMIVNTEKCRPGLRNLKRSPRNVRWPEQVGEFAGDPFFFFLINGQTADLIPLSFRVAFRI